MKTLAINGLLTSNLKPNTSVGPKVIRLARPQSTYITNASAPRAPAGYAWPHLAVPPRFAKEAV